MITEQGKWKYRQECCAFAALTELGQDGWELVGVKFAQVGHDTYVLKHFMQTALLVTETIIERVMPLSKPLSTRESQILGCLVTGLSDKGIARELDMAEATVKCHLKALFRKINARNRTQAAVWGTSHGGRA